MNATDALRKHLVARTALMGVLGLGYVGLTEALELARDADLAAGVHPGTLTATTAFQRLHDQDALLIRVATPLSKGRARLGRPSRSPA